MKPSVLLLIPFLLSCGEKYTRTRINSHLEGNWKVTTSKFDPYSSGIFKSRLKTGDYVGHRFSFGADGTFAENVRPDSTAAGFYKTDPGTQSAYRIFMEYRKAGKSLKKELWAIENGRGNRRRAFVQNTEGEFMLILEKQP